MANKYATIDPHNPQDVKDLFTLICKEIAFLKPADLKRKVLGLDGSSNDVNSYEPTMDDIVKILEVYDVKSSFKITYPEMTIDGEKKHFDHMNKAEEASVGSLKKEKLCDIHKKMKDQAEEIKNPDLKEAGSYKGDVIVDEKKKDESIDVSSLDPPPEFML